MPFVLDKRGRIKGAAQVDAALRNLDENIRKRTMRQVVGEIAELAAEEVQAVTPVGETGNLKEGIHEELLKSTEELVTFVVGPHRDQWYGLFVEYGTTTSSANPFMRPTFDSRKRAWQARARRRIAQEVTREAKRLGRL